ncbi:hypothetical protein MDOR_13270 [Mycolicibacterium doricum]|uniref:NADP-dependent oxidoreductase domain-containing protein n=1 Tax=Mycolicibacterium doricum TaxID=126673 RepID=A0A7I7VUK8_9MYCO|nr:hypothetical protein MDOR_13270 [Mycolicibacterium doricum]
MVALHDGDSTPQVGFGVRQTPPEDTEPAVAAGSGRRLRHVDTAAAYGNGEQTGRAIADFGPDRSRRGRC